MVYQEYQLGLMMEDGEDVRTSRNLYRYDEKVLNV